MLEDDIAFIVDVFDRQNWRVSEAVKKARAQINKRYEKNQEKPGLMGWGECSKEAKVWWLKRYLARKKK